MEPDLGRGWTVILGETCWAEIALHTGCRLPETRIPMICVDFVESKITFPSPEGGEDRAFSIPMPSALRPLLDRLVQERKKCTLDFPFQPSRRWQQFFIKMKLPHLCFHCLHVTYVNRLRRAGVPREAATRLVNHASDLVHQIYQREKVQDVEMWRDAVTFPGLDLMGQGCHRVRRRWYLHNWQGSSDTFAYSCPRKPEEGARTRGFTSEATGGIVRQSCGQRTQCARFPQGKQSYRHLTGE